MIIYDILLIFAGYELFFVLFVYGFWVAWWPNTGIILNRTKKDQYKPDINNPEFLYKFDYNNQSITKYKYDIVYRLYNKWYIFIWCFIPVYEKIYDYDIFNTIYITESDCLCILNDNNNQTLEELYKKYIDDIETTIKYKNELKEKENLINKEFNKYTNN